MVVTEIIRFGPKPASNSHSSAPADNATIQEAIEALRESKRARHESLGTDVKDQTAVQITAEWDDDHQVHLGSSAIVDSVYEYLGQPSSVVHVVLNQAALGPDGPATASVIEFAANYFPISRITPDFKDQIEADFVRFDKICKTGFKGDSGLSYGWVLEEQNHGNIRDENVACFLIIRGWESLQHYQQSVATEAFKEAIPILLAWNAPHEIVSVRVLLRFVQTNKA